MNFNNNVIINGDTFITFCNEKFPIKNLSRQSKVIRFASINILPDKISISGDLVSLEFHSKKIWISKQESDIYEDPHQTIFGKYYLEGYHALKETKKYSTEIESPYFIDFSLLNFNNYV